MSVSDFGRLDGDGRHSPHGLQLAGGLVHWHGLTWRGLVLPLERAKVLAGDGDFGVGDDVGALGHPQRLVQVVAAEVARRDDEATA